MAQTKAQKAAAKKKADAALAAQQATKTPEQIAAEEQAAKEAEENAAKEKAAEEQAAKEAEEKAAEEQAAADAAAEEAANAETPGHDYFVAKGKSLTTLKGICTAGQEITAAMLSQGDKTLKDLVKRGYVVDNT